MFDASKTVDIALMREAMCRNHNGVGRTDLEVLQDLLAEERYCEANGIGPEGELTAMVTELERRLGSAR